MVAVIKKAVKSKRIDKLYAKLIELEIEEKKELSDIVKKFKRNPDYIG